MQQHLFCLTLVPGSKVTTPSSVLENGSKILLLLCSKSDIGAKEAPTCTSFQQLWSPAAPRRWTVEPSTVTVASRAQQSGETAVKRDSYGCQTFWKSEPRPRPFCCSYFSDKVLQFCSGWPWNVILLPMPPSVADHRCALPCLAYLLRWGLINFLPRLASNHNPPNLYLSTDSYF
jgi:hypothetical protein